MCFFRTFNDFGDETMAKLTLYKKLLAVLTIFGLLIAGCSGDDQEQVDLLESDEYQQQGEYQEDQEDQEDQENYSEENLESQEENVELAEEVETNNADLGDLDTVDYGNIALDEPAGESSYTEPVNTGASDGSFSYTIERGDWLSKISQRVYGSISDWPIIADANPQISNPDLIYPNNIITIPITNDQSRSFAGSYANVDQKSDQSSDKVYVNVKAGDTLGKIAKRLSGSSKNWKQVWEQNKDTVKNPNMLKVGQTLEFTPSSNLSGGNTVAKVFLN